MKQPELKRNQSSSVAHVEQMLTSSPLWDDMFVPPVELFESVKILGRLLDTQEGDRDSLAHRLLGLNHSGPSYRDLEPYGKQGDHSGPSCTDWFKEMT